MVRLVRASLSPYSTCVRPCQCSGCSRTQHRYGHERFSPRSVEISPARCSCSSVTWAYCIIFVMRASISTTGETSRVCSGASPCSACMASHAPMLTPYSRICAHTGFMRAYTASISGTATHGRSRSGLFFRAPCSGRSIASTCQPASQAVAAKRSASSLQPFLPWR